MRRDHARIEPVADETATPAQAERLAAISGRSGRPLEIFRTLVTMPDAYDAFMAWGAFVLSRHNPLPARERELAVLRTGWLCRAGYEWTQHVPIAKRCGLDDDEIERVKLGAEAPGWSVLDAALIRAVDELISDHDVSDATWAALGESFTHEQRMGLVFTVGQYTQVSMMLNAFGVQLDEGLVLDPEFPT